MRIGFIEPHLERFGGIRRVIELGNHLVDRGHEITYFVPETVEPRCTWMPCHGTIENLRERNDDELDFIIYNNEPDWFRLDSFPNATKKVFFALHFAQLYDKEGSWECLRRDVDLLLANSTWTADMVEAQTGIRPETFAGGINRDHFHPVVLPKEYPILAVGDHRPWKGQEVIDRAGEMLGLGVETYAGKDLRQSDLATEYAKAEVFVVGSDFEGFGQPGLEALACGTPLVTTDNGGCRDYAIDRVTALVVPQRDPQAMADAIEEIRSDAGLAATLRRNGLDLVAERFSWAASAAALEGILERSLLGDIDHRRHHGPSLRARPSQPTLSLVVLAWDQLELTQRCVTSLRLKTDAEYELIIVDNGSSPVARSYAEQASDISVINESNQGFARGMNQGLAAANGTYTVFINNDTVFPDRWASRILETFEAFPDAGIVAPAVTAAANAINVRSQPGERQYAVPAFSAPPGAVVWAMPTEIARQLGGFPEIYEVASGEDVDLGFTTWVNGLEIVIDERVLVRHVSKGTATRLDDWQALWARNRNQFLERWTDPAVEPPRLASCPDREWHRNRSAAVGAAHWMKQYFRVRDDLQKTRDGARKAEQTVGRQRDLQKIEKLTEKYDRLARRRSVRIALALSSALRPLVREARRRRWTPTHLQNRARRRVRPATFAADKAHRTDRRS